jgi:flagellar hook-length control protein FliK
VIFVKLKGGERVNTATVTNMGNNISALPKAQQKTSMQSKQIFGHVFGEIMSNQQLKQSDVQTVDESQQNFLQELLSILELESLEEAEVIVGSDDLSVSTKEMKDLLNKLLGNEEDVNLELDETNMWDLLAGIGQHYSQIIDSIVKSLSGQGPVTQEEAKQAVQLLKIVQLIGRKTDLTLNQESTLFEVNQLVDDLQEVMLKVASSENKSTINIQTMKQVIRHVNSNATTTVETKEITTDGQGQSSTVVQSKVETVSMTLPTGKHNTSEELMKDLQKAMNRAQFGQTGGANRLVIKLYPEHLGTIRIELIQKDGMLTAKLLASTALGKELLDSNSNQLKQGLVNQNIQVDKLEITQALQDTNRQERNQSFQESFRQKQQQEKQEMNEDEQEKTSSFEEFLKEMGL